MKAIRFWAHTLRVVACLGMVAGAAMAYSLVTLVLGEVSLAIIVLVCTWAIEISKSS